MSILGRKADALYDNLNVGKSWGIGGFLRVLASEGGPINNKLV